MEMNTKKIQNLFSRKRFEKNEFNNQPVFKDKFPELWSAMDECIFEDDRVCVPDSKTSSFGIEIPRNHIDFQWHTRSIAEHTDWINEEDYFQVFVIDTFTSKELKGHYYDTRPTFKYFDVDGVECFSYFETGKSYVFNPRKPHSVIYYGESYLVACRTVVRKQND